MARPRSFDETAAVSAAAGLFAVHGYEGTSVDDLVRGLGVHRGSLYAVFGSKRALYLRVLTEHVAGLPADDLTLLLRAAVERAPVDRDAAVLVRAGFVRLRDSTPDLAALLGQHLIHAATTPRESP